MPGMLKLDISLTMARSFGIGWQGGRPPGMALPRLRRLRPSTVHLALGKVHAAGQVFQVSAPMVGIPGGLPAGVRLSDHISLGVIATAFPPAQVRQILAKMGQASERDLPAHVMVYYAIALGLYMGSSTREVLRCLLEGLRWLWVTEMIKVVGRSGISQARSRLGEMPLRRLYKQ
jgi:hypothetical protein